MRRLLCSLAATLGVLGVALATPGCFVGRLVGRTGAALVSSPRKVDRVVPPVRPDARLSVLWVGHATALVQIGGKVVLTDPVFTSTVGQLSKRLVEPGVDPADLPPIDAVLISHLHYDHLSLGSLAAIEPKVRALFLPRTGLHYLTDFSFPALELRPWQSWERDGLRVTAVPVNHTGYRYAVDRESMTEGFTGYVVESDGLKVYFGGDTAYDRTLFVQTAERFPGIDLALLPIGPLEPRSFMRRYHVDPAEAVQAFFDLGARRMVPIHHGTFVNSDDEPDDALVRLAAATARWSLGGREVLPLAIGERRVLVKMGEVAEPLPPPPMSAPPRAPSPAPPETFRPPSRPEVPGQPAPPGATPAPKPKPAEPELPDDDRLD